MTVHLSGTESAILNRESGDSKVPSSIVRMWFGWRFWIDFPWFYFTPIRLIFMLLAAVFFWRFQACDSGNRAIRDLRFCASEIPPVLLGIPWPVLKGPLQNHFWKKRRPQPYWGGENSGNALEPSNALNYRAWGILAGLSRGIPGKAAPSAARLSTDRLKKALRGVFCRST